MPFEEWTPEEVARRAGSPPHRRHARALRGDRPAGAARARAAPRGARARRAHPRGHARHEVRPPRPPAVLHRRAAASPPNASSSRRTRGRSGCASCTRALVVISSDIVATAPMPDRLREIGWTRHEAISDSQLMISYYRTTDDGRIVFGKGGWGIALGGRIGPRFDRDERPRARGRPRPPRDLSDARRRPDRPPTGAARSTARAPASRSSATSAAAATSSTASASRATASAPARRRRARSSRRSLLGVADEWSRTPLVDGRRAASRPSRCASSAPSRRAEVVRKERAEAAGDAPRASTAPRALAPAGLEDKEEPGHGLRRGLGEPDPRAARRRDRDDRAAHVRRARVHARRPHARAVGEGCSRASTPTRATPRSPSRTRA